MLGSPGAGRNGAPPGFPRGWWRRLGASTGRRGAPAAASPTAAGTEHGLVMRRPATTRFPTWGTYVFLGVGDADDLAAARGLAEAVLDEVDRTCSRFRDDSDLTRVNAAPGTPVAVDPLLAAAVAVARDAAEATDGLVDPLLGRDLVHLGYDRDFAALHELPDPGPWTAPEVPRAPDRVRSGRRGQQL